MGLGNQIVTFLFLYNTWIPQCCDPDHWSWSSGILRMVIININRLILGGGGCFTLSGQDVITLNGQSPRWPPSPPVRDQSLIGRLQFLTWPTPFLSLLWTRYVSNRSSESLTFRNSRRKISIHLTTYNAWSHLRFGFPSIITSVWPLSLLLDRIKFHVHWCIISL